MFHPVDAVNGGGTQNGSSYDAYGQSQLHCLVQKSIMRNYAK